MLRGKLLQRYASHLFFAAAASEAQFVARHEAECFSVWLGVMLERQTAQVHVRLLFRLAAVHEWSGSPLLGCLQPFPPEPQKNH